MTNAHVFHHAMLPYGGRLDREQRAGTPAGELYDRISEQADDLIGSARQTLPGLPPIYFDFVYNRRPNAYAFKANGQYFIGLTTGALVLLQLVFCRMLADSRLLPYVGDPESEASDLPLLTGFFPDAQRMREAGMVLSRPKTEARWRYSCHLLIQAVLFLIGHEIAHITRGHVDYLVSKTGIPILPEIGPNQLDATVLIERQALEGDADQRSFISRMHSAHLTVTTSGQVAPPWLSGPPTLEQILFDCVFSVDLFFRLFGDIRFAGADLTAASYPPHPLRRAMLRMIALMYVNDVWGSKLNAIATSALRSSSIEVESAFAIITGESVSTGGMDDAFSPEGRTHMKLLAESWSRGLRDRLALFTYETSPEPPAFMQQVACE